MRAAIWLLLEPAAGAGVEGVLEDFTRLVEVQVLELVDRLLVELGDLLERGRVRVLGARRHGDCQQGAAGEQDGEADREGFSQSGFGGFREAAESQQCGSGIGVRQRPMYHGRPTFK